MNPDKKMVIGIVIIGFVIVGVVTVLPFLLGITFGQICKEQSPKYTQEWRRCVHDMANGDGYRGTRQLKDSNESR